MVQPVGEESLSRHFNQPAELGGLVVSEKQDVSSSGGLPGAALFGPLVD
jgi:hypothetical protein